VLLLELILDDWAVEEALERVEELELSNQSVAVIEALGQGRGESPLELLDSLPELVEVVIETPLGDIHDVVLVWLLLLEVELVSLESL